MPSAGGVRWGGSCAVASGAQPARRSKAGQPPNLPSLHTLAIFPHLPPHLCFFSCSWKLNAGYLQGATKEQLVNLGKMTSLEHRRHVVDPTLLGLHEVGCWRGGW